MHQAFWDLLRSSLESDPIDYSQALRLLEEVKESLLGLLTNAQNNRAHIEAKLDIEKAKTSLAEAGYLDLAEYGKIVIDLMSKMCAPARDDEVLALRKITDPIELFKEAFRVLDLMRMDMANYTIAKMRSTIRQQAVHYEKENFSKILETQRQAGIDGLFATKIWLKKALDGLVKKLASSNPHNNTERANLPVPNLILAEAYVTLLDFDNDLEFPETLSMDRERIAKLNYRLTVLVCLASIVLFCCNLLSHHLLVTSKPAENHLENQWHQIKSHLMFHCRNLIAMHIEDSLKAGNGTNLRNLSTLKDVVHTQVMKDISAWVEEYSNDLKTKPEQVDMKQKLEIISQELVSHISLILEFKHPVYVTLFHKAHDFLRLTLQSNAPSNLQVPPGFGIFQDKSLASGMAPSKLRTGLKGSRQHTPETSSGGQSSSGSINYDAIKLHLQPLEMDSLVAIATTLLPIATHNKYVHGNHYADIIQHFYTVINTNQNQSETGTSSVTPENTH